jgi:hypothetical protein
VTSHGRRWIRLSALPLLPRFPAALHAAGADAFVHRHYAAVFASVPALAIGSVAAFLVKDRLSGEAVCAESDGARSGLPHGFDLGALRPDEELAIAGVVLAFMAERLEHDPVAYPALACAAAQLVAQAPGLPARPDWTGLTERARRAAVEVLRPLALATAVRAVTWDLTHPKVQAAV